MVMWVARDAANLEATERARQLSGANEGANKLSLVPGDPQRRPVPCHAARLG
jgi:hypothetical protein